MGKSSFDKAYRDGYQDGRKGRGSNNPHHDGLFEIFTLGALRWHTLLELAGEVWDPYNKTEDSKVYERYKKIKEALKKAGYDAKNPNGTAETGDTVEFLWPKRGVVWVRASARFVEAARRAKKQEWDKTPLLDWLGLSPQSQV